MSLAERSCNCIVDFISRTRVSGRQPPAFHGGCRPNRVDTPEDHPEIGIQVKLRVISPEIYFLFTVTFTAFTSKNIYLLMIIELVPESLLGF